ncbi:MAG: glycosyltransferase [Candidatus Kapabacteria bacterium]|nr:glycosyltransferase [Candidatus Kapabacteria bacterium]
MKYSIVIAVFNRPDELSELLESLAQQTFNDFEVIVVEDGSSVRAEEVCARFGSKLQIDYYYKENSGPGPSRNYGCRRASGDYFLFIDSDCTVPSQYLEVVDFSVSSLGLDAFGGPDREHERFSPIQKAISFAMTSVLTTGGIRGGARRVGGAFHPRSFNMGISRAVFNATDGFATMRFGEDVEFSIRMIIMGYNVKLIPDAWVYHKRRTDFSKFFKQVHNSGIARINISLRHHGTLKLTHFFPTAFTLYLAFALVDTIIVPYGWATFVPLAIYTLALFLQGFVRYRSILLGVSCIAASYVQLIGYGTGFIRGLVLRVILNRPEQGAFEETFYK